ncbi:MAG: HAMP domain-containing histidine kinase [Clostridia bacterium]|nr:HAMP domain-containing histidine kinase [Clostridia bacterium]
MIYRLQKRFILICSVSLFAVIALVFCIILVLNITTMNRNMDILADRIYEGGGSFPGSMAQKPPHENKVPPRDEQKFDFITPETPFSTRHFTVVFDTSGAVSETMTDAIFSITDTQAVEYATKVIDKKSEKGWLSSYRYKIFTSDSGRAVVFVDGSMNRSALTQSLTISGFVLLGCATLVLLLIVLLSKKAVKPIAEGYEKQKQFITDASHELKTPLTLILANAEIAEVELGASEWLADIRTEGQRMADLVNQLVALSRMDEDGGDLLVDEVPFGELVYQTTSEFEPLAKARGKILKVNIDRETKVEGNEEALARLVGILLDNAVKYCDENGEITVTLTRAKRATLIVENTFATVGETELDRLFDRFYRADKARTFTGGYGIGLSMAKAIVEKHKGEILAYKKDDSHIGFRVVL